METLWVTLRETLRKNHEKGAETATPLIPTPLIPTTLLRKCRLVHRLTRRPEHRLVHRLAQPRNGAPTQEQSTKKTDVPQVRPAQVAAAVAAPGQQVPARAVVAVAAQVQQIQPARAEAAVQVRPARAEAAVQVRQVQAVQPARAEAAVQVRVRPPAAASPWPTALPLPTTATPPVSCTTCAHSNQTWTTSGCVS